MRVLLANPPWRREGRLGVRAGSRWAFTMPAGKEDAIPPYVPFPFFLAYAAAVLERSGVEVQLIDAILDGVDRAVVRTATMFPEELEAALIKARRQWRWRQFRRNFWKRKSFYLREGLRNPGLALKFLRGEL